MMNLDFRFQIRDFFLSSDERFEVEEKRSGGVEERSSSIRLLFSSTPPLLHFASRLIFLVCAFTLTGCIADGKSRLPQERVTWRSADDGQSITYLKKPAIVSVHGPTFDAVWQAVYRVTRNAGFYPELEDYRTGRFMTRPFVSSQWFEAWRGDTGSIESRLASSLATIRRTVYWQVKREADGTFSAAPKVLVERFSMVEHRVTSNAEYNEVFALTSSELHNQRERAADPAAFAASPAPPAYWYATGRDEPLEQRLAAEAQERIRG
jgi:hypothetical protein